MKYMPHAICLSDPNRVIANAVLLDTVSSLVFTLKVNNF